GVVLAGEAPTHKGVDDPHLGEGDVEGPAHVAPRNIGALLGALEEDPAGGIDLGEAGVGFYEADGGALGGEALFFYVVGLLKTLLHVAEEEIGEIGDVAPLELIDEGCAGGQGVFGGEDHGKLLIVDL